MFYNEYQPHPKLLSQLYRVIKNNVQMIDVDIRHKERFDYVMGMCTDKDTIDE